MQKLKDSELRYRRLFETALDGILILDAKTGMIDDVNPYLINMLGYSREEFVKKKLWEVGAFRDVEASKEAFEALQEQEYIRYDDLPLKAKDGQLIQVEFVSNVYLVGNEKVIQCNIRNITERKLVEKLTHQHVIEMEMLYQNGLTLSQLLSPKEIGQNFIELLSQKMKWHHTAIRMYHPQSNTLELLVFSHPSLEDEEQFGKVEERFNSTISKSGEGLSGWAIQNSQLVRSNNLIQDPRYKETFPGMQSGLYVPITSGRDMIGVIAIESEKINAFSESDERLLITMANQAAVAFENAQLYQVAQQEIIERKRVEVLLAEEKDQLAIRVEERTADLSCANLDLANALRVKDEFLASMSHELRTPLTGILGFSEALQLKVYGELNNGQLKIIKLIEESGRHLLDLINDILDLAKIGAGKLELQITPCSIADICQASLQLTKGMSNQKHLLVHYSPPLEPLMVYADARRLKQILVNLLSNAIKFTPEKGEIGLEVESNESEKIIKLIVWDKGIGIKPEDTHKLFIPFVQIDNGLAREYSGTGLGLSLVKQLTELHNGGIEMKSKIGEGSRFSIILPWSPRDTTSIPFPMPQLFSKGTGPLSSLDHSDLFSILIADDNEIILQMISDYLESKHYNVTPTRNGFELLKQAAELYPDVILVDIQMPGMDGLEAIRRIRSYADPLIAQTPIIAVTALAMTGDRERCLKAGANEYISKPIKLVELTAIIKKLIEKKVNSESTSIIQDP